MRSRSLRHVVPLVLLALLLLVGGVSFMLTLHGHRQTMLTESRHDVLADVARLVRLNEEGMGASSSLVATEIAQIACRGPVRLVLLIDDHGRVLAANHNAWKGLDVGQVAPQLDMARVQTTASSRLPDWRFDPDTASMDALQSYELPSQPDEVRSSRRGLAYVRYDLADTWHNALSRELWSRVPDLIGLVLMFACMQWLLSRHVTRPLSRLDQAANDLRANDWSVDVPRGGFREIDQLAAGLDALRQELSATWHAVPDPLFELDAQGRYLRVVAVRPELLINAPQNLVGRSIHDVLPPEAAHTVQQALDDAAESGGVWGREMMLDVPAGRRWFDMSVARKASTDNGPPTFLLISRDTTDRKENALALARLNEELEHRVQERTAELLHAKNEAEHANQSKSEFLSRMSHELRTPLNAILGFGQLLSTAKLEPKQLSQIQHIVTAGQHLLELINEILDLARVEAGQMSVSLEPVALVDLLHECMALVKPLADANDVQMFDESTAVPQEGWRVHADRTRLKQVLINLLSNGIKYNRRGGTLRCRAEVAEGVLRLDIIDSGMGLRPEQLARLFTPFERLDADARQIEGTGIGLALSKRLVDLMGGQIGAHSEPGQGSCFWVSLPLSQGAPAATTSPPPAVMAVAPAVHPDRKLTVLCIEDNAINLQLLEHALQDHAGMRMLAAVLPTVGLQLARERQPDVILLDINLPIMSGYDVLARLLADPDTAHIPVIAVTANAMASDQARAHAAGFAAYVTKPIDMPALIAEIQRLARTRAYDPHRASASH